MKKYVIDEKLLKKLIEAEFAFDLDQFKENELIIEDVLTVGRINELVNIVLDDCNFDENISDNKFIKTAVAEKMTTELLEKEISTIYQHAPNLGDTEHVIKELANQLINDNEM